VEDQKLFNAFCKNLRGDLQIALNSDACLLSGENTI
jgi:hypothetical protein